MHKQLAFSTLGCPQWDFETIITQAAALGFAAVEVRGIGDTLRIDQLAPFQPDKKEQTQALLDANGVRICSVGTSVSFHDRAGLADALQEGREALAVCSRMGIPAIRVFGDADGSGDGHTLPWQQIADGLLMLCDAAIPYGVQVWMEIHGCVNTAQILSPILRQLDGHPAFGLIWDIQHSFRATGNDFMPFYKLIKPYTRHVHVKDGIELDGGVFESTLPGEGQIDIAGIVRQMLDDGYTGLFSFEWEKRWEPELPPPEVAFPAYVRYMAPLMREGE